jgi:MFS transporter, DHA1 family, multidrug resistance protein
MGSLCFAGFILSLLMLPPVKMERTAALSGKLVKLRYLTMIKNRRVAGLCVFEMAYIMCIGAVWSFVPLIADARFNLPTVAAGIIITLSVLVSAVLIVPMGRLADRYDKRKMMAAGGVLAASSMLLLAWVQHGWQLYLVGILIGIGGGIASPAVMAQCVIAGRQAGGMASMMALIAVSNSFGMMAGPVLIGMIIDISGMTAGFMASCIWMSLAIVFSFWAVGGKGRSSSFGDKENE